jgi:hypothetical protein
MKMRTKQAKCKLQIHLEKRDRNYAIGEKLTGFVEAHASRPINCTALTLTPEWRTHGKGNVAKGETATITLFSGRWESGETKRYPFSIHVPVAPITYHGRILNVDWFLKARAHIPWAIDPKTEESFTVAPDLNKHERKPRSDLWPEERRPDQTMRDGILTVAMFFGIIIFGLLKVILFFAVLSCLAAVMKRIREKIVLRRLGPIDINIDPSMAQSGDREIELRVSFDPNVAAELRAVTAKFVARERVISGDSESDETYTQLLHEEMAVLDYGRRLVPGQRVTLRRRLQLPADAPPSFEAPDNHLEWLVTVHFDMPWPDWKIARPLTVLPAPCVQARL